MSFHWEGIDFMNLKGFGGFGWKKNKQKNKKGITWALLSKLKASRAKKTSLESEMEIKPTSGKRKIPYQ